jgi:NitT/TauT family transport system substrate-binding protein
MPALRILLLIALIGMLAGPTRAAGLTPYRVGYNDWVGFIAFLVGVERGDFARAGLDVQAKNFTAPGDGLVPLLNGNLDAHLTTLDAVVLKSAEAPGRLKIVQLIDTSDGADAVLGQASEIKSPADLKGKRVAVTLGECNEILLVKALETAGLTEKDVDLVNMDPDAAGTALKAGQVDAAVTWEPWISQLVGAKQANTIYSSVQVPNILADCVAITPSADREATHKFLTTLAVTTDWTLSHPEQAAELVSKKLELPVPEIVAMLKKVKVYDTADSRAQMAGPALQSARELSNFFYSKGSTPDKVDVTPLFDTSLLP